MKRINLIVKGNVDVNGTSLKHIEGGFGEGSRSILAGDIAMAHEVETKYINKIIKNNISRFNDNDLMDIKGSLEEPLNLGFTAREIANYKNIFLLSERGYTKLVAMLDNDNDKKWEVMDNLIDGYFAMREHIEKQKKFYSKKNHYTKEGSLLLIENKTNESTAYENLINNAVVNEVNRILDLTGMKMTFIGKKSNINDSQLSKWRARTINLSSDELGRITTVLDAAKNLLEI